MRSSSTKPTTGSPSSEQSAASGSQIHSTRPLFRRRLSENGRTPFDGLRANGKKLIGTKQVPFGLSPSKPRLGENRQSRRREKRSGLVVSGRRGAILLVALALGMVTAVAPRRANAQAAGSLAAVVPPAEVGRDGSWTVAAVGAEIGMGDALRTGAAGRLKVVLADGSVLVISERSELVIDEHVYRPAEGSLSAVLQLLNGKVRAIVSDYYGATGTKFEIKTETAVAGVRGTDFVVRYDDLTASTEVIGVSGRVTVSNPSLAANAVIVTARTQTRVERGRAPTEPRAIDEERFRYYLDDVQFIGGAQPASLGFSQPLLSGKEVPAPEQAGAAASAQSAGGLDLDKLEEGPGLPDAAGLGDQPPAALEAGDVGVRF